MTELQQRTLQVAKRYLKVTEDPPGSNRGRVVDQFGAFFGRWMLGQPWCAAFATWAIYRAGHELGVTPMMPRSASSSELYRWAVRTKNLLPFPQTGCLGLVIGGPTGHSHTCLIHAVEDGGRVVLSVDGNWRNRVTWVRRPVAALHYVRIV